MARKVIVSKFKFFILKLWEFARLFRLFQSLLEYIYIYVYVNILWGKKDATTFSRQACFVIRFTLQGFNPFFFLLKYLFRSASTYWALFHAKIDLQTPYMYMYIYLLHIYLLQVDLGIQTGKRSACTLHTPNSRSFHSSWM